METCRGIGLSLCDGGIEMKFIVKVASKKSRNESMIP